jgi:Tfp pilus assembly protein PilF
MLQVIQAPGRGYDFFHYVVLDGIDQERKLFRTQFGDGKARWVKYKRLDLAWKRAGYAAILVRPKDPASDALRAAVSLEEKGLYPDAARAYRAILNDHPDSVVAWTNLGNAEKESGNINAAEQAFRKAIALDPTAADALNNLAWLLYEQKRLEEAEPLAEQAVAAAAPDVWMRLDTLARIQAARGKCAAAAESWKRAVEALPKSRETERREMQSEIARARANCRT